MRGYPATGRRIAHQQHRIAQESSFSSVRGKGKNTARREPPKLSRRKFRWIMKTLAAK